jgi:Xaa-Pro aminopeptidase
VNISKAEINDFRIRRKKILKHLGSSSLLILIASSEKERNNGINYPYRQNSNFHYLTGFNEPSSAVVFFKSEIYFFCRVKNKEYEQWNGKLIGPSMAKTIFEFNHAFDISKLEEKIKIFIKSSNKVYLDFSDHDNFNYINNFIVSNLTNGKNRSLEYIYDANLLISQYRQVKSSYEIKTIKKSCEIASLAHIAAMKKCKAGINEFDLENEIHYTFGNHNARHNSYPPIVASGKNACILHYTSNNQVIKDNSVVLIDAGCEYLMYASDITRSFPANGKFTSFQKDIYSLVLDAQNEALKKMKIGNFISEFHNTAVKTICDGLSDLKIIKKSSDEILEKKLYLRYYMHGTGHFLGLDVHDVGMYSIKNKPIKLQKGMVITLEPGIYINQKNLGIRIEDDILIDTNGPIVLTKNAPKSISQIEEICS